MAKQAKRKASARAKPARPHDPAARIVEAAFDLASGRPWQTIALADIAQAARLPLAEVYRHYPSKTAILGAFLRRVDAAVLARPPAADDTVRDRLFDLVMRRLDALRPHKAAMRSILGDLPKDPPAALCLGLQFLRAMAWMAEAAGVETSGLFGALKVKGLAAVYLYALRTWMGDDSPDQGPTMGALDQALKRAEMLARSLPGGRRGATPETA